MLIGTVLDCVTSTAKDAKLVGLKLLVVKPEGAAQPFVAVDTVGAGIGETVLVVTGGAAREADKTVGVPTDASIIAIIDPYQIVPRDSKEARGPGE